MKFITELSLKSKYYKSPFQSFYLESSMRLTPEAKRFLLDKKIEIMKVDEERFIGTLTEKQVFHIQLLVSDIYECALLAKNIDFDLSQTLFRIGEAVFYMTVDDPDKPSHIDTQEVITKYQQEALSYKHLVPIMVLGAYGFALTKLDHLRNELLLLSCQKNLPTATIYQFVKEISDIIDKIIQIDTKERV
ncbi:hypothetical protein KG091_08325 [Carnobacteriaceae bacterium zg-ZUI78]|nr:hypothetical protein [Carnobacteriaceae bacterium zg-ZUI78]